MNCLQQFSLGGGEERGRANGAECGVKPREISY